ncbi:MAG: hypothetical protein ACJAVN_002445 [Roseivirga sp.]|jgi:hypothetical protein
MKGSKLFLMILLAICPLLKQAHAQSIPSKLAEQVRLNARKSEHVTAFYTGKVEKVLYSGFLQNDFLNGIVFRKSDGQLLKLWIKGADGAGIKPFLLPGQEVEVKVSGDPNLLKKLNYKDPLIKKQEKELKERISGLGYLLEITTKNGTYTVSIADPTQEKTSFSTPYETRLGVEIQEIIKLKNRSAMIVLKNGDSLDSYSFSAAKKHIRNNKISYLRPTRAPKAGYSYKTNNTFTMTAGNLVMSGSQISRIPVMNYSGVLIDYKTGSFKDFLPNLRGLVDQMNVNTELGLEAFKFSTKNAKELKSFFTKNDEEEYTLFFKSLTPDGNARSKKDNILYAICSENDTLYTDDYYNFLSSNRHYNEGLMTYEGLITKIHYPDKVNKTSIIKIPQTIETGFRSLLIDDKVYLQVRDVLALSIAQLVEEGKSISVEGWTRKDLGEEINLLGYTIMIPSKVIIDGKTFTNEINLKTAL